MMALFRVIYLTIFFTCLFSSGCGHLSGLLLAAARTGGHGFSDELTQCMMSVTVAAVGLG